MPRWQAFLQRMMALCVASHYRNTPNDLILMSDAPAHHLFVLLGPVDETQVRLLCYASNLHQPCPWAGCRPIEPSHSSFHHRVKVAFR